MSEVPVPNVGEFRVTILVYRNPKLTSSQFHHHWTNVHVPKVSAHLAKFGITRYRQYHTPHSLQGTLVKSLPSLELDEDRFADYDGMVELLMPDLGCYERAMNDQYYKDVIAPDELEFADMKKSKVLVGWEETYVENGKAVNRTQQT